MARETETIRQELLQRLETLDDQSRMSEESRGAVTLDQQSVGRLSRMDALQGQAMAQAQERQRADERARIELALRRVEDGSYGICEECGNDIPEGRLALDPAATLCVPCKRLNEG